VSDLTLTFSGLQKADPETAENLLKSVYGELRLLARSKLAREQPGQTLQPTALVHEAWLRLVSAGGSRFENRAHFFSAAAEAMRRILIDRARRKLAVRHGGQQERSEWEESVFASPGPDDQLLAVHEALDLLAREHPVQAELVKLRYFAGMTHAEAAALLGVSEATARNYWTFARTWLFDAIKHGRGAHERTAE
jgi:RNA polymerase sigma factor (TIGR02999 family)